MQKRAVIYARVSRDDTRQEGRNLEGQVELGEAHAKQRGYSIVARLREDDKGASGAEINLPQLNKVREMAEAQAFDVLVVREIDRLSRSLAKQLIIEQELKKQGIEIEYVMGEYPDTPEGNFMRHIRATVAEYEREKINERVIRGRYSKVKAGSVFVSGHAPYGYRLIQDNNQYRFEIEETEAEVVRMIYSLYLGGLSSRKIAARLSELGIPSYTDIRPNYKKWLGKKRRAEGTWSPGSINRILKCETYAGVWRYGKNIGRGGKQKRALKDQVEVAVPVIINRETWQAAQATRINNRAVRRHESGYDYLLKGHIYCEHCGHRMGGRTSHVGGKLYAYYRCNAYRAELVNECSYSWIHHPAATVDSIVWGWITSLLTNTEQLRDGLEAFQAEKEEHVRPLRARLALVQEMLESERAKLDRLLDLYLTGEFSKELLAERRGRLETQIASLEREEVDALAVIEAQTISDEQILSIQNFGREIAKELDLARSNGELMRHIINILNLQVWLSGKDRERFAMVRCGIGQELLLLSSTATCDNFPYSNQRPSR